MPVQALSTLTSPRPDSDIFSCTALDNVTTPELALRHGEQHDPAVRVDPLAIEGGCDFLSLKSWKRNGGIVSSVTASIVDTKCEGLA
jgi:hypothetical protein